MDAAFGFERLVEGPERTGYLLNMLPTTVADEDRVERAALSMYFLEQVREHPA